MYHHVIIWNNKYFKLDLKTYKWNEIEDYTKPTSTVNKDYGFIGIIEPNGDFKIKDLITETDVKKDKTGKIDRRGLTRGAICKHIVGIENVKDYLRKLDPVKLQEFEIKQPKVRKSDYCDAIQKIMIKKNMIEK